MEGREFESKRRQQDFGLLTILKGRGFEEASESLLLACYDILWITIYCGWNTQFLGFTDDIFYGMLSHPFAYVVIDFIATSAAFKRVLQPFSFRPFRVAHEFDRALPLAIFQSQELNVAIGGFKYTAIAEFSCCTMFKRTVAQALHGVGATKQNCSL